MGLGRCKEHCNMDEKELDKCKKKNVVLDQKWFNFDKKLHTKWNAPRA